MEASKRLKVCYFGNDLMYWTKIKERFETTYSDAEYVFTNIADDANKKIEEQFVALFKAKYSVIYIDLTSNTHQKLNLCKYLSKDNITKLIPTVALHSKENSKKYFQRSLLSGIRLNHIKCSDLHDVVYDALTFLDVDSTLKPDFACAAHEYHTHIYQDLRLTYTTDSYFHVETNSPLTIGEEFFLEKHFLNKIMNTKFFYVKNEQTSNLYYNSRYSFDLYFTYCDDPFDQYINNQEENEEIDEGKFDYHNIITRMEKDELADKQRYIKRQVSKWILNNNGKNIPKTIKILAIDRKLELFKQLSKLEKSFPYNINIQSMLGGNQYQISRILPHFIVYNMDNFTEPDQDTEDINGIKSLKKIITAISKIDDYEPIIVIFQNGSTKWDITTIFEYPKLISNNIDLSLEIIQQLGETLASKLKSDHSINENRVYFKASDDESIIVFMREIKIVSMTESIIYFLSDAPIPDWTVFTIKDPIEMLLTVVPHKSDGSFHGAENTYRALINGTGEIEKQNLRTFINKLVEESNKVEELETTEASETPKTAETPDED